MAKAQAVMEFLTTYGFSIAIVTMVGIVLWNLGIISPCTFSLKGHYDSPHLFITDFIVISSDSPYLSNKFYIYVEGKVSETITIENVSVWSKDKLCGHANMDRIADPRVSKGDKIAFMGNVSEDCEARAGDCYSMEVRVEYISKNGLEREESGSIWGNYESRQTSYSYSTWERTEFGGDPLTNENNNLLGSYQGNCPASVPSGGLNWVSVDGRTDWNQPGCCSSHDPPDNPHQVGFENAYCIRSPECLAHGWMRTKLTMNKLFVGHKLYISGEGEAPSGAPDPEGTSGYICIDDNFYFYVNEDLIYYSGTTGYDSGPEQEVWRGCDGCRGTGWCIPPVELTASSAFKYGEANDIYVMLEDYCGGGTVSEFQFFIE